jgi:flagellar protein FliO/FliZ
MSLSRVQQLTLIAAGSFISARCLATGTDAATSVAPEKASPLTSTQDPMAMIDLWQLTLAMLLVLGLILGIAWLLKRSGRFRMAAGGDLRIMGGLSMGTRERVVLLQVGETQLLVGVAPGRVQTLHVLDQPLQAEPGPGVVSGGFADQLGHFLKKEKTG